MIVRKLDNLEEKLPPLHHDMVSNEIFTPEEATKAGVAISILGSGGAEPKCMSILVQNIIL